MKSLIMTKLWTSTFIIACVVLIGCGDDTRKQLTGVKQPPFSSREISEKVVGPIKSKVEHLLDSGEITRKSQMDPSDVSLILLALLNKEAIYTGHIINGFDSNPFRGNIVTLKITPTGGADQTAIQIITGRGEFYQVTVDLMRTPEVQLGDYKLSLHKEMDCLILKKLSGEYSAVVCEAKKESKVTLNSK